MVRGLDALAEVCKPSEPKASTPTETPVFTDEQLDRIAEKVISKLQQPTKAPEDPEPEPTPEDPAPGEPENAGGSEEKE